MNVHCLAGDHIGRPQNATSFEQNAGALFTQKRGSLWPSSQGSHWPSLDIWKA